VGKGIEERFAEIVGCRSKISGATQFALASAVNFSPTDCVTLMPTLTTTLEPLLHNYHSDRGLRLCTWLRLEYVVNWIESALSFVVLGHGEPREKPRSGGSLLADGRFLPECRFEP
jgi:hypothetical protein